MSPATNTAGHNTPRRRLSSRRGSITASDPYALHADINEAPDRVSSSKLTIVKVLPNQHGAMSPPPTLNDPPSSFTSASRRRSYRMGATSPPPDGPPPGRLSFAFSSFGGENSPGHHREGSTGSIGAPPSPTLSPRMRPVGPNQSPRLSAIGGSSYNHGKPRLTPEQLVELARQATSPRTLAQIATASSAGPSSPAPGSPIMRSHSPAFSASGATPGVVAPATFTPLPDDIYLPFVDRPYEVAQLISTPPDAKLFNLLAQTLPKTYEGPLSSPDPSFPDAILLPLDPVRWTYTQLHAHLTQVDRDVDSDVVWVAKARKCIMSHSELIWERVKGCFGVPPELDHLDWDWEREERMKATLNELEGGRKRHSSGEKHKERMRRLRAEIREGAPKPTIRGGKLQGGDSANWEAESAIDDEESDEELEAPPMTKPQPGAPETPATATTLATEDISSDEGKVPGGHWSDWDETIESPIYAKSKPLAPDDATGGDAQEEDEEDEEDFIEIEALVASSDPSGAPSPGSNPPPLTLGGSMLLKDPELTEGNPLGDIAEGEEEEEEEDSTQTPGEPAKEEVAAQEQEEELIPPAQIQGLRISTAPVHASGNYGVGGVYVVHHPHPLPFPSEKSEGGNEQVVSSGHSHRGSFGNSAGIPASETVTAGSGLARTHSRTSSFSSITGVSIGPFSRSESTGNLAALMAAATSPGSDAGDSTGYASDSVTAAPLGDRPPGHPLFVSNFARLNGLPTLSGHVHGSQSPPRAHGATSPPPGHYSGKRRSKRTGSTSGSGFVGTVPSSSFIGSKGHGGFYGGAELGRVRTNSQGSMRSFRG
ncbi:hypothetical protein CC1G_05709 [Coprinopsis cinerea okayama7|uniref:Uncharacterized protein n=1 Tax=Coprinopsis cinerea (strain Okayama-7 / 130 / ATCC MYA-4618 / FGSC 9003) TaxID=240176 RepID=A8N9Y2_COPC7|nr:hypothetical protein CC1G_05709 [Coprinopsis cinerea okayama7\|eukprot:XP_001831638.2 hypothetical protein CC1G_05709 [Coprinopsis cinerea okayama7\